MSISPAFAPKEPAVLIDTEHAFFVEIAFEAILYGFTLCLYIMTINNFINKRRFGTSWKLIVFLTMQQIAVFLGVAGNINFQMLAFVDNRNIPGGPAAYQQEFSNRPFAFAALAGFTISTWLQDVMMGGSQEFAELRSQLYRFLVIWNGHYLLLVFPITIFLASIAFGLILLIQTGQSAGLLSSLRKIPVPIVFFSLSVGLNAVLTILIIGRLLIIRRRNKLPGYQHVRSYVSGLAIIIESAALYTIVGLAQVISLRVNPTVAIGIEGMYGMMTALAPHLIVFRMSQEKAWTRLVSTQVSAGDFAGIATRGDIELDRTQSAGAAAPDRESHKGSERSSV